MLNQPESLIALVIYFAFFGLIGARRGWKKELFVFALAFLSYLGLLQSQGRLAFVINTAGNYALAGFPSDQEGLLAVFEAQPLISGENQATFIFLLWAVFLFVFYFAGDRLFKKDGGKAASLGFMAGIANGILYLSLIATRLFPIFDSGSELADAPPGTQLQRIVTSLQRFLDAEATSLFGGFSQSDQRTLLIIAIFSIIGIASYSLFGGRRSSAQKK